MSWLWRMLTGGRKRDDASLGKSDAWSGGGGSDFGGGGGAGKKGRGGPGILGFLPAGRKDPRRNSALWRVAGRLGLKPSRVAYVLWHDPAPYRAIHIPKRDGRTRLILAPSGARKFVQRMILRRMLDKYAPTRFAHGFVKRRDIFTGAKVHVDQPMVIRIDIADFFPTITAARIGGVFKSMGFEGEEVRLMVKLCTHEGRLPQGAPTSPALANLVCRRLDRRLGNLAVAQSCRYTRYADDMTFSGAMATRKLLPLVRRIIKEEGFTVAENKTRIMRYGRRQEVTGLVVNKRMSVPRYRRRWIRAIVYNSSRHGVASQNRANHPRFESFLLGNIQFIRRTHPRAFAGRSR